MLTKSIFALAVAIILGLGSTAFALEGLDGDNNPIPGQVYAYAPAAGHQP